MTSARFADAEVRPRDVLVGVTDLHIHLEGSLSIRSAIELGGLRGHPWGALTAGQLRARFRYANLGEFLMTVRDMCQILASPEALYRCAYELTHGLAKSGAVYAEVYCSPYIFVRWGLPESEVFDAMDRGFSDGEQAGGSRCAILLDSVRQWGPEAAHAVLDGYTRNRLPRIVGFGLGGDETYPLENFTEVFDRVRAESLQPVVHAGETGPASDVEKALDLGVVRIAHGIRAMDQPRILDKVIRNGVTLDIALTSNYRTKAVEGPHPIRDLLDRGAQLTLNSDDPSLFRTDLRREYVRARRCGVTDAELGMIAAHGIEASFANEETKVELRRELDHRLRQLDRDEP